MAWRVIVVESCLSWLHELRRTDRETLIQVSQAITALAEEGPALGRPLVDTIAGSRYPNMKELRPGSAGETEVRLLLHLRSAAPCGLPGRRRQGREMVRLV
jgi:hypothetical protein